MSMSVGSGPSRGKGRRSIQAPEINVTPLVDVMLVLLIIFMITVQAARESIPMELPAAQGKAEEPDKNPIEIGIDENSRVHAPGGKEMDLPTAERELTLMFKGQEKATINLSAHRKLPYETIVKVVSAIREAGVETINLSVDGTGADGKK